MENEKCNTISKRNKVFIRNECAIQDVTYELMANNTGKITVTQIAKKSGLTRQTVYNHYPNIKSLITSVEDSVLKDFYIEQGKQFDKLGTLIPDVNTRLFYSTMIFMAQREKLYYSVCKSFGSHSLIYRMVAFIYPKLEISWLPKGRPTPEIGGEQADMLIQMLVEIICKWSIDSYCDIRKAHHCIHRLTKAIETAATNRLP